MPSVYTYRYKNSETRPSRFISELRKHIDPYDTEILTVGYPENPKHQYLNEIHGSLQTLKSFGILTRLTHIRDKTKMYRRIFRYTGAGKKRKHDLNDVSNMLLSGSSCWFYTHEIEYIISNTTKQVYNMHRTGIIALYYGIIKNRLIGD